MTSELRLALDVELWLVEELLFEARLDDLVADLVARGVPADLAREQVLRLDASDGMRRLRVRTAEARLAARLQRLEHALRPAGLVTRETIEPESLLRDHWIPSLPCKLTRAFPGLRAASWTPTSLRAAFGDVAVAVNVRRGLATDPRDVERHLVERPLASLLDAMDGPPSDEVYAVSRCGLLDEPGLRALWDDLAPLPPFLVPPTPPRGVSLWMGPGGTHTRAHFDPHNNVLLQVFGRKRVRIAPRIRADIAGHLDGWTLRGSMESVFGDHTWDVELGPGEALFLPAAWVHEVVALEPSITLSFLNFPWPNHFHHLGPPGADDRRA